MAGRTRTGARFLAALVAGTVTVVGLAGVLAAPASAAAAPVCLDKGDHVAPGQSVDIAPACTDADGDSLTFAIATQGTTGTAAVVGGLLRYTANPGTIGTGDDVFTYTASDGNGGISAPATVRVTVASLACGGRVFDRTLDVWYGSALVGANKVRDATELSDHIVADVQTAIAGDATVDARGRNVASFATLPESGLEWTLGTPESLPTEANLRAALTAGLVAPVFEAVANRGTRTYLMGSFDTIETAPVFVGDTDAPVLCGGLGETLQISENFVVEVTYYELNVHETNRAPVCATRTGNVNAGASVDVAPSCTDADSDPLTYAIASQGTKGTASVVSGQLRYVAIAGSSGSDSFTYTANDGHGGVSNPAMVTITITAAPPTNHKPVCANRTGTVNAGASVDVAPSCTDADTDPLTYAIASQGTKGTASVVSGQLRYVANAGSSGSDSFRYTANDGHGGVSDPAMVTITITTTDDPCRQLSGYVTGSPKYQSASPAKRLVPHALVAGACAAVKSIQPTTPASHRRILIDIFKAKVVLLRAGGWLTDEQATTLKSLANGL